MPAGWKFFQIQMHGACHLVFESLAILYSTYHLTPKRIVFAFPNEVDKNSDRNFSLFVTHHNLAEQQMVTLDFCTLKHQLMAWGQQTNSFSLD